MADDYSVLAERHLHICRRFGNEVSTVGDRWHSQSPCGAWDARGVLEHVIGFHDVLLLRPLGAKPQRPKDDPVGRWMAAAQALEGVFERPGLFDGIVDIPPIGNNPPSQIYAAQVVPLLSRDVLIHTWDIGRSAGHEITLDPEVCRSFLEGLPPDIDVLAASGLYDMPKGPPAGADNQALLLARLGRDPTWSP